MKNKLDKEYLLKIYETYEEDNMFYALTMLKSLGLKEWFKTFEHYYIITEINILVKNINLIDMYNLDTFDGYNIHRMFTGLDNSINYFNQEQLNKLDKYQINIIIKMKPELEKHLVNCKNYGKEIKGETFFYPH